MPELDNRKRRGCNFGIVGGWRESRLGKAKVFASGGHGSVDLLAQDFVVVVLWEVELWRF